MTTGRDIAIALRAAYLALHRRSDAAFEKDLLTDLIPFVEKTYPVRADRESRAVAGLSMGGGQALNFGLNNLDAFAWVGGFSSAPNTRRPADLIKDPAEAAKKLRLLYVACGDKDTLFRISEGVHKMLDENKVPHVYRVIPGGGHDFRVWKSDLYHLARLLLREPGPEGKGCDEVRFTPPPDPANRAGPLQSVTGSDPIDWMGAGSCGPPSSREPGRVLRVAMTTGIVRSGAGA